MKTIKLVLIANFLFISGAFSSGGQVYAQPTLKDYQQLDFSNLIFPQPTEDNPIPDAAHQKVETASGELEVLALGLPERPLARIRQTIKSTEEQISAFDMLALDANYHPIQLNTFEEQEVSVCSSSIYGSLNLDPNTRFFVLVSRADLDGQVFEDDCRRFRLGTIFPFFILMPPDRKLQVTAISHANELPRLHYYSTREQSWLGFISLNYESGASWGEVPDLSDSSSLMLGIDIPIANDWFIEAQGGSRIRKTLSAHESWGGIAQLGVGYRMSERWSITTAIRNDIRREDRTIYGIRKFDNAMGINLSSRFLLGNDLYLNGFINHTDLTDQIGNKQAATTWGIGLNYQPLEQARLFILALSIVLDPILIY